MRLAHSGWKPLVPLSAVMSPASIVPPIAGATPPVLIAPPVGVMSVVPPAPVVLGLLLPQPSRRNICDKSATVPMYVAVRVVIEALAFFFAVIPCSQVETALEAR
jgi:hypothetical protein